MTRSITRFPRLPAVTALACLALMLCVASSANAAFVTHIYDLNNTYADTLGGPSMVPAGGTLGLTGYTFAAEQGPSVSNAIDPYTYSIEMKFTLDALSAGNYRKLIDFKDRTVDAGLYKTPTGAANFSIVGNPTGPAGAIALATPVHLVATRDGASNLFTCYVDGVLQFSFTDLGTSPDTAGNGRFTATNNIIQFMIDNSPGGENPIGFLDYVHLYAGVLTDAQAAGLSNGSLTPSEIPEPASLALLGGAAACLLARRRSMVC
jgi:hypothetical protein